MHLCIKFEVLEIIANGGGVMKKKFLKIIKENGFLLFLFMCVCLVAASTIFVVTREVDKPKDNEELIILEDNEIDRSVSQNELDLDGIPTDKDSKEDVLETITKEEVSHAKDDKTESQEGLEEETKNDVLGEDGVEEVFSDNEVDEDEDIEFIENYEEEPVKTGKEFIRPVEGEVITVFTTDGLIYSETLDEWRGHSGIDIRADTGTKVKAPKEGTIKKVEEDELWGITIVIDHGNGLETKYANLGTKDMVQEGVQVKQGDYIGTVGKTASIEMLMDSHLHFEVIKDGKLVDPRSIME